MREAGTRAAPRQTADYCRVLFSAFGVDPMQLEGRVSRRLGRQAVLTKPDPPELHFLVSELALRQPVGGPTVMARQVRRMVEEAERPHVSIRVLPASVAAHPGLLGGFVVLDLADEPAVVFIEGRMSGMFPENPDEVADYRLAAERLADLATEERQSYQLLCAIAEDLERVR